MIPFIQNLRRHGVPGTTLDTVRAFTEEAERIQFLLDDLLYLSEIESGTLALTLEERSPFGVRGTVANDNPPGIGGVRGRLYAVKGKRSFADRLDVFVQSKARSVDARTGPRRRRMQSDLLASVLGFLPPRRKAEVLFRVRWRPSRKPGGGSAA
ncbi:MAG: hypothetical protein IH788_02015, partial [Nitrospinae bacterium]|nr:hypothetical protein [Nitrospinota bacterium]